MKATNRFAKGSGVYKCGSCGRATRSTGRGDNELVKLCAECYDLAGLDNSIGDGNSTYEEVAAEYQGLVGAIEKLGGDASGFDFYGQKLFAGNGVAK